MGVEDEYIYLAMTYANSLEEEAPDTEKAWLEYEAMGRAVNGIEELRRQFERPHGLMRPPELPQLEIDISF